MFNNRRVYLDNAAGVSGNPSSPHEEGLHAKDILENARIAIARLVEVQQDDVIFTSGATESNALAILGYIRALRPIIKHDIHVLYLPSAHTSIVENIKLLAAEGVFIEALPIKEYRIDINALVRMLRKETALISMDAVCGETGVVWNTREVAEVLQTHNNKNFLSFAGGITTMLHVDASQAPLTEKISRAHFGANLLTFDASKVGNIRGIGALIAHRTIPMISLYKGGGQERGLRPGSENPIAARDFAVALDIAARMREKFRTSAAQERVRLIRLIKNAIPNVSVQEGHSQVPHILNISLLGRDTDYVVALLNEAGFSVSTRSACETDSEEGSRAVFALTEDLERARVTLRISWGPRVRPCELNRFAKALIRSVAFIDNSG